MRRRALSLLAPATVALLAVACGSDRTDAVDVGAAPTTTAPTADPAGSDVDGVDVAVYLTRGTDLVPASRTVAASADDAEAVAAEAVRALLAGPTAAERRAGLGTEIPDATRFLGVEIGDDRVASVDLSGEFQTGGGSASMQARLGQVACTLDDLTALDVVDGTSFLLDGEPVRVFSGEGIVLDGPVTCADYHEAAAGSGGGSTGTTAGGVAGATGGPRRGSPSMSCVDGWTSPSAGDPVRAEGLDLLRQSLGTDGRFVVTEIRYFTGPDTPGVIEPRHQEVERWYVKARLERDPLVRGRFLVVKRGESGGVEAVAPYDSAGYFSPDWTGFEGEGEPVAHPGLPGRWAGVPYDFVTRPGLPDEVEGCLSGS